MGVISKYEGVCERSEAAADIARAEADELGEILSAVLQRYAELFPDWEVNTISLHKNDDRNEQNDRIINLLMQMKTSP